MSLFSKIFGTHSQHEVKRILPIVDKIEALAPEFEKMTDEELQAKTPEFKERLANGETLDDILPEAYATVREAATRVLRYASLSCTVDWWCDLTSGTYYRDAYR